MGNNTLRIVINLPDLLFRRAKATAARRGITLKALIVAALERETQVLDLSKPPKRFTKRSFPVLHLKHMKVLDLTGFNFDDLLP